MYAYIEHKFSINFIRLLKNLNKFRMGVIMKKKYMFVLILLVVLSLFGFTIAKMNTKNKKQGSNTGQQINVVTSFYPMYIAALNITKDMDHVNVINMTGPKAGCLHDYQLTPENLITLSTANVFIVNGGGIESFLDDVLRNYPDLAIITASDGIELLTSEFGHLHEGSTDDEDIELEDAHDHGDYNAHVWMNIGNYMQQVDNITTGLSNADSEFALEYAVNAADYTQNLTDLKMEADNIMSSLCGEKVIIFHDAFMYFADEYGMEVEYVIDMDENTTLSAGQIATLVEIIKEEDIHILFAEEQYGTNIASTVGSETDVDIFILDSLVTGEDNPDSYITGVKKNLEVLGEAFGK